MTPTSEAQARATADGSVPPLERIRDRVWVVPLAMPGDQPRLRYTLTYLLVDDDDRVHVVDPGWDSEENWSTLEHALAEIPSTGAVASIIATHLHFDHLGMAARLREATGASLVLHEREAEAVVRPDLVQPADPTAWGVPEERRPELAEMRDDHPAYTPVVADLLARGDVDRLPSPGLDVEILHTPGHTAGSVCLRLPHEGLLLTGDHVLPAVHPGLGLGGPSARNPLAEYLDSLGRVLGYDDHEILPGHNHRFRGLAERVAQHAGHHRRRTDEVERALSLQPDASVFEIASTCTWTAGWERMTGFYLYSALAQTAMHIDFLRTSRQAE